MGAITDSTCRAEYRTDRKLPLFWSSRLHELAVKDIVGNSHGLTMRLRLLTSFAGTRYMPEIAYINGKFTDLGEAKVPVEDRGFQYADGVYEVIVAPDGLPFKLEEHLKRLKRSTDAIGIHVDYDELNLPAIINEGICWSGFKDVLVYIQITRGVASRNHIYSQDMIPTVVATFKAQPVHDPQLYGLGVSMETVDDVRWAWRDVKSIALLANVVLKNAARQRGLWDAIIVGPDGVVLETTSANLFVVSGGRLRTAPATDRILHGVTRGCVLEFARELGISCIESEFDVPEMMEADEVFATSTTLDVLPVVSIDGRQIGSGKPGVVTKQLLQCFPMGWRRETPEVQPVRMPQIELPQHSIEAKTPVAQ